ncbi:hypothetical protein ACP70R_020375 [Stipagrostis hirtigluma subsp. patula]
MLMAAMHIDTTHAPSSSSASPPPWLAAPAPAPADHRHLLYDFTASPPSPPLPAAVPPPHRHHRLLRATPGGARRVAKRRPRPSRRLPTTYISADPASFRRMVHQVTGADDLLPLPPPPPPQEALHRPAPFRSGATLLLPTLDTSAFLLGGPAPTASPCDGFAASPVLDVAEDGGAGGGAHDDICGGFPTLESWDALF